MVEEQQHYFSSVHVVVKRTLINEFKQNWTDLFNCIFKQVHFTGQIEYV